MWMQAVATAGSREIITTVARSPVQSTRRNANTTRAGHPSLSLAIQRAGVKGWMRFKSSRLQQHRSPNDNKPSVALPISRANISTSPERNTALSSKKDLEETHFRDTVDQALLSLQLKASVMFLARRATAPARRALVQRQPRRFDSHSAHHEPVNEHLGRGFYIAVASIPVGLALYKYSTSDASSKPWLTRAIETFTASEAVLERNNALHTRAIEEAAADRHLFHSQNPPLTIDMSFPELFNTGSPINMSPGRSSGDLSAVVAHYEKRQADMEKARVGRMKDGKVQSLYEDGRYF
ncbi:hypothetical protein GY631_3754 [Trichophyton interdigitale]|uniref:NADH-ubiquinone oxidoreductase 17.8 kDa subunit, mitochondrial n=2 Tax=Trichophyton interdigitale TaxID=101480 RepID=A0A9P4YG64_9EURO|nr:hypothetical protein GY631_3754 [Trichophyton interdigitale]KAF3895223.1 hypothetical protein GY632_3391 [Trichophyton interdigitale]